MTIAHAPAVSGHAGQVAGQEARRGAPPQAPEQPGGASDGTGDDPAAGPAADLAAPGLIYFEIDDLLVWLTHHLTLSGIQRVQANIVRHLLSDVPPGTEPEQARYAFVRSDAGRGTFWRLELEAVRSLIDYCIGDRLERRRVDALLRELEEGGTLAYPSAGECYVIMGAFWVYPDLRRYLPLKTAGASFGVYLYDLIPVSHPEFCDVHLVRDFALSLGEGFTVFDFALTISEYSAREVRRYIARHGLRPIPVQAVPLAHVLKDVPKERIEVALATGSGKIGPDERGVQQRGADQRGPGRTGKAPGAQADTWAGPLAPLRGKPFVLSVSTIEARKNHAYLVACWRLLVQEGADPPDLVLVGRFGWRVDDLMGQLRTTQNSNGRVHVLHNLPDPELETLYRHCLFTAFPSFVEGWGLPVGESLAHGAPCVASSTSSIPEVGGDLIEYIDPYDLRDGVRVLRRMMFDAEYREGRRAAIRTRFHPRTWEDVARDFLGRVSQFRSEAHPAPAAPLLRPGEVLRVSELHNSRPVASDYAARPLRLVLAAGWHPIEDFGAWMGEDGALLRFATPYQQGEEVVAYLQLRCTPKENDASLTVTTRGHGGLPGERPFPPPALVEEASVRMLPGAEIPVRLLARVRAQGVVEVGLRVDGDVPEISETDERRLSVGIVALGYALRVDAETRADLTDALANATEAAA